MNLSGSLLDPVAVPTFAAEVLSGTSPDGISVTYGHLMELRLGKKIKIKVITRKSKKQRKITVKM